MSLDSRQRKSVEKEFTLRTLAKVKLNINKKAEVKAQIDNTMRKDVSQYAQATDGMTAHANAIYNK